MRKTKKFTEQEKERKERLDWFLQCNMEELLQKSIEEDWRTSELEGWVRFKTAQFLEKIAYAEARTTPSKD